MTRTMNNFELMLERGNEKELIKEMFNKAAKDMPYIAFVGSPDGIDILHVNHKEDSANKPYANEKTVNYQLEIPQLQEGKAFGFFYIESGKSAEECSADCMEILRKLSSMAILNIEAQAAQQAAEEMPEKTKTLVEELTPREKDILRLIATGHSNSKIANALVLSVNTVKTHVSSIYGKLNINSRAQAAIMAKDFPYICQQAS